MVGIVVVSHSDTLAEGVVALARERIAIHANVGGLADARQAVASGAEGVGLLRTEFLFLGRAALPDEE